MSIKDKWRNFSRRANKSFSDEKLLKKGQVLAGCPCGEDMVYAVNPVYLETGQGGISPMRGFGVAVFFFPLFIGIYSVINLPEIWSYYHEGAIDLESLITGIFMGVIVGPFIAFCSAYFLAVAFLNVTDPLVRFDRKRQKVWMWTGRGPVEIAWANLTPRTEWSVSSAQATVRIYRGQFVELGEDGQPLKTRGVPHVIQCGSISADDSGVRQAMEYVRIYMDEGFQSLPKVQRLLQHRPKWWAMINFANVAQDWVDYREGRRPASLGAPWGMTIFMGLLSPMIFPLQITNWLALMVAPIPKWPKDLLDMHAADLEDLAQEDRAQKARKSRKPVIRVNGEIVNPDGREQ